MPANLTPQYQQAEDAFKAAVTDDERLCALEEMLKNIPKHKGTEKMQADIKKRISKLRTAMSEGGGRKQGKVDPYRVPREGAAQVFIIGPANSGKSSMVGWLTNAKVVIAPYPYSTTVPISGMMQYEDISIQLVDTPPVLLDDPQPALFSNARLADVLIVVIDSSDFDSMDALDRILEMLKERKVLAEAKDSYGAGITADRLIVAANKCDLAEALENAEMLRELIQGYNIIECSAVTGQGLHELAVEVFKRSEIARVYAKPPGGRLERKEPFIVKRGATVEDVAEAIHRDLRTGFRSAKVWGSSKYAGQSVHRDFVITDGDIVEFDI